MVAVSFDAHDTYVARKKKLPPTPQDIEPGFLDIFHYAFCYVGVLTGKKVLTIRVILIHGGVPKKFGTT